MDEAMSVSVDMYPKNAYMYVERGHPMSSLAHSHGGSSFQFNGHTLSQGFRQAQADAFEDEPKRQQLTQMAMRLFEHWKLTTADQLALLGLSANSRRMLTQYRKGKALANNRDMLDRIGWLLVIHQNLRTLYPQNPELCYSWVNRRNRQLDNWSPLEVMKTQGFIGIFRAAQLSEHLVEL
jgi:ribosomal protein S15P/S13E